MGRLSEVDPFYFYGANWSRQLLDAAPPGVHTAWPFIRDALPGSYNLAHLVCQWRFNHPGKSWKADLYHEPYYLPFRFSGPTVITVHDISHLRHSGTHPPRRVAMLNNRLPHAIAQSSQILTDSEFIKQEIISEFRVSPSKIHAVPLGVSSQFQPLGAGETRACLENYSLSHGRYFLAVGTLEPRKNLTHALRAFQALPSRLQETHPLVIVGMQGWLTETLETEIRSLEAKGKIRWLGYVPREHLPMLYAGAAVFLYPSLYEGFGLPPLEAMASGVPVVSSDQSSLPEVVGEAGIMLSPHDLEGWAQAMRSLIEDPEESKKRVQAGLARARTFTWEKCARQTLQVYRMALDS
jgi:alpha-1,3-rhamnosyl/mannosyltransferase